jgi:hypothetical protein
MPEDILIEKIACRDPNGKVAMWNLAKPEPAGPVIKDLIAANFNKPFLALVSKQQ